MKMQELWYKINYDERLLDNIFYLRDRWVDESEYESIDEYLKAINHFIPKTYKIYKKPFGFKVKCDDGDLKVTVKVKGNEYTLSGEFFEKETPMDKLVEACKNLVDRTSTNAGFIKLYEDKGTVYILINGATIDVFNSKDKQLKQRVLEVLWAINEINQPIKSITMPLSSERFDKLEYFDSEEEPGSIDLYIRRY